MTRTPKGKTGHKPPAPPKNPAPPAEPAPQQPAPHHHQPGKSTGPINPILYAKLERNALDKMLGSILIVSGPGGLKAVLSQDSAGLTSIAIRLGRVANTLLPLWEVNPVFMGLFKRQMFPNLPTLAENIANSLRLAAQNGISFDVKPEQMEDLLNKVDQYSRYNLAGSQLTNIALDQRQISGSFLIFLLDRGIAALDKRFSDPKTTQQVKDQLLDDFGAALVEFDDVLRNPVLRRQEVGAYRNDLAQQAADAQAEAQLKDASLRVRQNLVLPREMLFAAARRYTMKQQQQQGPGVLSDQPTVTPPPPPAGPHTPRKIFQ